jgi:SAM-dependent methyltransferase
MTNLQSLKNLAKKTVPPPMYRWIVPGNPEATYVGDLATADFIPSNTFDCFILTQTLLLIYDLPAAFKTIYRILKPGGVVLATLTGICQMVGEPWEANQCWSFTPVSAKRLFEEVFPASNVTVEAFGNVLSVVASLQGIAAEELRPEELDYQDDQYPLIITVKATKSIEDGEDKIDSENADCGQ